MMHARNIVDHALATGMYAKWTTAAITLGNYPWSFAFSWHMFLAMPLVADWQVIAHNWKHHINENLHHANWKCCQYYHTLGQQVLKKVHDPNKWEVRSEGPYTIDHVQVNGNPTIILCEWVTKCINTHRVLPYCLTFPHAPMKTIISMKCNTDVFLSFCLMPCGSTLSFEERNGGVL